MQRIFRDARLVQTAAVAGAGIDDLDRPLLRDYLGRGCRMPLGDDALSRLLQNRPDPRRRFEPGRTADFPRSLDTQSAFL